MNKMMVTWTYSHREHRVHRGKKNIYTVLSVYSVADYIQKTRKKEA